MMSEYNRYILANIPYWLNIGSILHQYGCATRSVRCEHRNPTDNDDAGQSSVFWNCDSPRGHDADAVRPRSAVSIFVDAQQTAADTRRRVPLGLLRQVFQWRAAGVHQAASERRLHRSSRSSVPVSVLCQLLLHHDW